MINDGKNMPTVYLLASIVSRSLGKALQCLQSGLLLLSRMSSENLKVLHAIMSASFSLRAGTIFEGNVSSYFP